MTQTFYEQDIIVDERMVEKEESHRTSLCLFLVI